MIVLVTGGRDFRRYGDVAEALDALDQQSIDPVELVMQGGCPTGADKHARDWATDRERDCITIAAKWSTERKAAGPIRNSRMADRPYGIIPDICLAFPGGTGTADMVKKAKLAGIAVKETWR